MKHTLMAAVALALVPGAPAQDADPVRLVVTNGCGYSAGDLRAAAKAGVKVVYVVVGNKVPWASDIKDLADDGVEVRLETDEYWTSDLVSFGGRKGRVTLVVGSKKYWGSDLQKIAKAGVALEIHTSHVGVDDLKKLGGK